MSLNCISLVGRAGRDPELRFFESGSAVANLTLAVNKASSNRDEEPDWFNLEIWGKQAQVAADYVRKGSLIGVVGRMTSEQWTDRNTGEQRSKPLVKVERLVLLGSKADNEALRSTQAQAEAPPQSNGGNATSNQRGMAAPSPAGPGMPAQQGWSSTPLNEAEVPF
jgi:single-strand DNA-binding protein